MQTADPIKNQTQNISTQNQSQQNKNVIAKNISDVSIGNNFKNLNQNQNVQNLNSSQTPNQNTNSNQNINLPTTNSNTSLSFYESLNPFQNQNLAQGSANFPSKEYFNFQFFKRQMSSQSSDVDFGVGEREYLNDFFAARFNSVLSKDSSKQQSNIIKQSADRISCDFDEKRDNLSTNLENKDEQSQVFLTRANSACLNKCSNYIPKTFYFQRNNSNKQSLFLKNNNNLNNNINNEQNLLLRYYGNSGDYNMKSNHTLNKNKFLDVVNDKDGEDDEEDDEDDGEDGCILTNKEEEDFSLNYISRKSTQTLTLPKTTFTLVHRNSSHLLNNDKNKLSLEKGSEEKENINKKKLPPVKTKTYCGASKNNLNHGNEIDENEEKESNQEDKTNKEDSEFFDESKSNNDNEDKNDNEKSNNDAKNDEHEKNKKDNNNSSYSDGNDVPLFSELKNFKSKSNKNDSSNNDNNTNNDNNDINNYFFDKNKNMNNMNLNQNNASNNLNMLNMQNMPKQNNNNNFVPYQLNQNQIGNKFPPNYNTLPIMMGNMNQQPNNYPMTSEGKLIKEMQNLKLNNNIMNTLNNINTQQNYRNNNNNFGMNPSSDSTDDLLKNVNNYIKDQTGCRFIQKKIDENPMISNKLFEILYQDLSPMCRDLFGNYVVQKILENINPKYLIKFIELISKDFLNLAMSTYGTRVIQKILEIVAIKSNVNINLDKEIHEQCFKLINNHITKNIVELSSNNNSSHIIIKYVNEIRYPRNIQLFNEVYKNFIPLCKDKHGCCVIQKCIDLGSPEQKNKLLELSNLNCSGLISDQFGNYVIQFVVGLNTKIVNQKVYQVLKNNLCLLCKEKYASNVIEKFLANKSEESQEIINILLKDEKMLHELIIDQFGNYIIQRILVLVEGENRSLLITYIVQWYPEIKALPFGPRLISKLHERYQEFTLLVTQNYGWDTTQEIASYLHLNGPKFNNNNINKNNYNNNININNFNNMIDNLNQTKFIKRVQTMPEMLNNLGNNVLANRTNNNNCMNFKNKSNVGNINFIQMNNYMLSPGLNNNQNNPRLAVNNSQLFPNFNNINNLNNNINNYQLMKEFNRMNSGTNNNIFFQRESQQNYFNDINNNLINRMNTLGTNNGNNIPFNVQFNGNGNNNQNMLNYQQYLNMAFPNIKK